MIFTSPRNNIVLSVEKKASQKEGKEKVEIEKPKLLARRRRAQS